MKTRWILGASVLVALLALLGSCGEESTMAPSLEPSSYPAANSPDQLMANFVQAHNDRNYEEYRLLLHEAFVFHFAPQDRNLIGSGGTWGRDRELESAQRMFSGQPGKRPDGSEQAPVSGIDLKLVPVAPWTAGENPADHVRVYRVIMTVEFADGSLAQVRGLQEFTVTPVAEDSDAPQVYGIRRWRDLKEG